MTGALRGLARNARTVAIWLPFTACSHALVQAGGMARTAGDGQPLEGVEVRVHTLAEWEASCEELGEHERDLVAFSDEAGRFKTRDLYYPADCFSGCKRGVLCASLDGYETIRIEFDDCDRDEPVRGSGLILEFVPEGEAQPQADAGAG